MIHPLRHIGSLWWTSNFKGKSFMGGSAKVWQFVTGGGGSKEYVTSHFAKKKSYIWNLRLKVIVLHTQFRHPSRGPGYFPLDNCPRTIPLPTRSIPSVPLKTQLENYIYTYMYAHMHTYTYMHIHIDVCTHVYRNRNLKTSRALLKS